MSPKIQEVADLVAKEKQNWLDRQYRQLWTRDVIPQKS